MGEVKKMGRASAVTGQKLIPVPTPVGERFKAMSSDYCLTYGALLTLLMDEQEERLETQSDYLAAINTYGRAIASLTAAMTVKFGQGAEAKDAA